MLFYGGEDGDAIRTLLFKLVARAPLDGEVPGAGKVGFVDNRLIEIPSGEVVERVGQSGHGEMLAVDGDVERCAGRTVCWRRSRDARAIARTFRLRHLRLSGGRRENVGGHISGSSFDNQVEAVGEESAQHELDVLRCGIGRHFRADVVVIALQPSGTSLHIGYIDAVGGGNEFSHGGLGKEIPVALDRVAVHKGIGREWAGVDVGDDEGLGGARLLSVRRDGENREKDESSSHPGSLRAAQIDSRCYLG